MVANRSGSEDECLSSICCFAGAFAGDPIHEGSELDSLLWSNGERERTGKQNLEWSLPASNAHVGTGVRPLPSVFQTMNYIQDPSLIYEKSFEIVRTRTRKALSLAPETAVPVVCRIVHACGMPDVAAELRYSDNFAIVGAKALASGAMVLCDANATAAGVTRAMLPQDNAVQTMIDGPEVRDLAMRMKTTRSAAGVELWKPALEDSVVVIGNAPTALFRLLEIIDDGAARPALIIGFPVGFVGAAESKEELARDSRGIPYLTLPGTRGGSAMAAAALNALSILASERQFAEPDPGRPREGFGS